MGASATPCAGGRQARSAGVELLGVVGPAEGEAQNVGAMTAAGVKGQSDLLLLAGAHERVPTARAGVAGVEGSRTKTSDPGQLGLGRDGACQN